ncbi:MAG: GntR family transcriptional regulator [Anaerolineae bacterium]|nr:GntR family transcriptional regulator [Anaerolineae bacterium]MCB9108615.1 GntR family transcriptional regulator [Anaerolineales bacterium]
MLKRAPSLTELAKSQIKERILNEEFAEGRIPSEMELASELGVSRTTIRDALSRLELEGTIYRKQGAGTFVNEAGLQIKTRLEEIWTYESILQAHGYAPSTRIINISEQPIDATTASDLALSTTETILLVKKLFLADGEPVILTHNFIPTRLIATTYRADVFHQPIYQFLHNYGNEHLAYYLSEIVPLIPSATIAETLNLPLEQSVLISFEEIGYNQDNKPIIKAFSYFRDDLLRLRLIRRGP